MLPGMAVKARIAIVGAGNLGAALAVSLRDAGIGVDTLVAHSRGSLWKAREVARRVSARAIVDPVQIQAQWIWFCMPDSEIARAAAELAKQLSWKGRVALHSSGALTSDVLNPLRRSGAAVASVHPLMTFVRNSLPSLTGVAFAIEGDPIAVRVARRIVGSLGGEAFSIQKKDKAAYHAWGMFASPLLAALLATTEEVATMAGVGRKVGRERVMPILRQTLENYAAFGAPGAFSGPIIRGDVDTVRRHLRVLKGAPVAHEVYIALARAALEYLPAKNKTALKRVLASGRR
jgi:predicted short-subunit dehydrogenase-like oxidoreductase (DUF2520 family)